MCLLHFSVIVSQQQDSVPSTLSVHEQTVNKEAACPRAMVPSRVCKSRKGTGCAPVACAGNAGEAGWFAGGTRVRPAGGVDEGENPAGKRCERHGRAMRAPTGAGGWCCHVRHGQRPPCEGTRLCNKTNHAPVAEQSANKKVAIASYPHSGHPRWEALLKVAQSAYKRAMNKRTPTANDAKLSQIGRAHV